MICSFGTRVKKSISAAVFSFSLSPVVFIFSSFFGGAGGGGGEVEWEGGGRGVRGVWGEGLHKN